jgi:hypothetical protein
MCKQRATSIVQYKYHTRTLYAAQQHQYKVDSLITNPTSSSHCDDPQGKEGHLGHPSCHLTKVRSLDYCIYEPHYCNTRWEAARDWKASNRSGSKQEFEKYWNDLQRDEDQLQVCLVSLRSIILIIFNASQIDLQSSRENSLRVRKSDPIQTCTLPNISQDYVFTSPSIIHKFIEQGGKGSGMQGEFGTRGNSVGLS